MLSFIFSPHVYFSAPFVFSAIIVRYLCANVNPINAQIVYNFCACFLLEIYLDIVHILCIIYLGDLYVEIFWTFAIFTPFIWFNAVRIGKMY